MERVDGGDATGYAVEAEIGTVEMKLELQRSCVGATSPVLSPPVYCASPRTRRLGGGGMLAFDVRATG